MNAPSSSETAAPSRVARSGEPAYGVGIGYRSCIHKEVMGAIGEIDFLEIPADEYVDANRRKYSDPGEVKLKEACSKFPAVGHGTDVSVGSAEPVSQGYLDRVVRFADRVPINEYSEHMTCT